MLVIPVGVLGFVLIPGFALIHFIISSIDIGGVSIFAVSYAKIESKDELDRIQSIGDISRDIVNTLDTYSYKITKASALKIFERIRFIIY